MYSSTKKPKPKPKSNSKPKPKSNSTSKTSTKPTNQPRQPSMVAIGLLVVFIVIILVIRHFISSSGTAGKTVLAVGDTFVLFRFIGFILVCAVVYYLLTKASSK